MTNPINSVTLVTQGGTMVQLSNQRGAAYPTTGHGSLVFNTGAHLIDPVLDNASINIGTIRVPPGDFFNPAIQFTPDTSNTPGFYSTGPGNISLVGTDGNEPSRALLASFDHPGNLEIPQFITQGGTIPPGEDSSMVATTEWVNDAVATAMSNGAEVFVGDSPPVPVRENMLWWSSILGQLFIYYNDGNTVQWVATSPDGLALAMITDVSPRTFGGIGDGIADDTLALQAAIDMQASRGGGNVNCTGGRWLIDSANLIIKHGVFLTGPWSTAGYATNLRDYSTYRSSLVVNSAFTIRLEGYNCGMQGLMILRKGLTVPTTLRQAYDAALLYAGTAVTIACHDTWLSNLLIIGFNLGITSSFFGRSHIQWISGDNTNGIHIDNSYDIQHLSHCHMWSYGSAHLSPRGYGVSVPAAADNGAGLVRLNISPLDSVGGISQLKTGDRVTVSGIIGVPGANGAFIITVVTPYNPASPTDRVVIDLQGSTFSGVHTSGGQVWLSAYYRAGIAYDFDTMAEWAQADNCFEYGYAIGFRNHNTYPSTFTNCGTDYYGLAADNTTIGFLITNDTPSPSSRHAALIGCKTAGQGVGVKVDVFGANADSVQITNHRCWGNVLYDYQVARGWATFVSCELDYASGQIRIDDGALGVSFIGGDLSSMQAISYESAASPRPTFVSVRGQKNKMGPFDPNLLIGPNPTITPFIGVGVTLEPIVQVSGDYTTFDPSISLQRYSASAHGPMLNLSKSQTAGVAGTQGIVLPNEVLGYVVWNGSDGVKFVEAAYIRAIVDGTPGVDSMPTSLQFSLSPAGSATPAEAMRLSSAPTLARARIAGAGQAGSVVDTTTGLGATLQLHDTGALSGNGGMVMFSAAQGSFATIKGTISNGSGNTQGNVIVSTRRAQADVTLTEVARFTIDGNIVVKNGEAPGVGATTQAFVKASSSGVGLFYGTGNPTFAAGKGSMYTKTDAGTTTDRIWVNHNGSTGWTNMTTAV